MMLKKFWSHSKTASFISRLSSPTNLQLSHAASSFTWRDGHLMNQRLISTKHRRQSDCKSYPAATTNALLVCPTVKLSSKNGTLRTISQADPSSRLPHLMMACDLELQQNCLRSTSRLNMCSVSEVMAHYCVFSESSSSVSCRLPSPRLSLSAWAHSVTFATSK